MTQAEKDVLLSGMGRVVKSLVESFDAKLKSVTDLFEQRIKAIPPVAPVVHQPIVNSTNPVTFDMAPVAESLDKMAATFTEKDRALVRLVEGMESHEVIVDMKPVADAIRDMLGIVRDLITAMRESQSKTITIMHSPDGRESKIMRG